MILALLYRQPRRLWQTLRPRHKLEALFLGLVLLAVPATRAHAVFGQWLTAGMDSNRLLFLILWSFLTLWVLIQWPLFHFLAGRQKVVALTATAPATPRQARQILFYVSLKYQWVLILVFVPLWTALPAHAPARGLLLALLATIGAALTWRAVLYLYLQWQPAPWWIPWLMAFILMAAGYYAYFLQWEFGFLALFLLTSALYVYFRRTMEIDMQAFSSPVRRIPEAAQRYALSQKMKMRPAPRGPLRAWIFKERLARERHRAFRLWRRVMFLWTAVSFFALAFSALAERNLIIFGLSLLYVWVYFGAGFNEKYRDPELPWLIQGTPLRLRDWWLARLWVEGGDALWGLLLAVGAWLAGGLPVDLLYIYTVTLIVLWLIFFAAVVNFQIMFYDNVRMAGYAFHFTMLLLGIMIFNYRLVGPLIALALMLFFSYKNYKYINR